MNSSQNKPLIAIFENSGGPIKSDLRAGVHDVYPGADRAAAMLARIERSSEVLDDLFSSIRLPKTKVHDMTFQSIGLINDPRARMLTGAEILEDFKSMMAQIARPADEIVIVTAGRGHRGPGKTLSAMLALALVESLETPRSAPDWCLLNECEPDLSPHPGERHRQVERRVHSKRSRAGKAGRWA